MYNDEKWWATIRNNSFDFQSIMVYELCLKLMKEKIEKRLDFLIPTPKKVDRIDGYCELPNSIFSDCEAFLDSCDIFCISIKKIFGAN